MMVNFGPVQPGGNRTLPHGPTGNFAFLQSDRCGSGCFPVTFTNPRTSINVLLFGTCWNDEWMLPFGFRHRDPLHWYDIALTDANVSQLQSPGEGEQLCFERRSQSKRFRTNAESKAAGKPMLPMPSGQLPIDRGHSSVPMIADIGSLKWRVIVLRNNRRRRYSEKARWSPPPDSRGKSYRRTIPASGPVCSTTFAVKQF
jgi:hypothetical protein